MDVRHTEKEAVVKADPCTFGYSTHMNCQPIPATIRWWSKLNIVQTMQILVNLVTYVRMYVVEYCKHVAMYIKG